MRLSRYAANLQVAEAVREEKRMDFNTGSSSGRPEDDRPLFGGETGGQPPGGPPRSSAGGTGPEFTLSDPVVSFIRAARSVILDPVGFFRRMARQGDFVNPAVYAVIIAVITALLGGILGLIISPLLAGPGETGEALAGGIAGFLFGLILGPIFTVIVLFIVAGIYHLLVLLLVRPTNAGFEATFRVVCYSYTPNIVGFLTPIPILGQLIALVAGIYAIVLSILGIREVHSTTTGKAALVVLIPAAVILFLVLLFIALVGAAIFFGTQQQF